MDGKWKGKRRRSEGQRRDGEVGGLKEGRREGEGREKGGG